MIPNKDEEFNLEFFQKRLTKFPKIKSFEIKKPSTHGMMSNTRVVIFEYEEENDSFPEKVIVKYAGSEIISKMPNLLYGGVIYRSEMNLYKYFEENKDLRKDFCKIPEVYFMSMNEKNEFIIIMEDLSSTTQIGKENILLRKSKLEEVKEIVKEVAKMHRLFWHKNPKNRKFLPFIEGNGDPFLKEKNLSWLMEDFQFVYHTQMFKGHLKKLEDEEKKLWGIFNESNISLLVAELLRKFESSKVILEENCLSDCHEGIEELYKKVVVDLDWKKLFSDTYRKMVLEDDLTMRHGDFRVDNISVDSDDGSVLGFFDWQCVANGNGLLDVSSILVCGLSLEEMKENEEDILKMYHKELDLEEDVSFEDVKVLFKHGLVYEMIKAVHWTADCAKYKDHPHFGSAYLGLIRQFENCLYSFQKNYDL